ncbi:hypothetical protein EVAR_9930_1 [Eumeta japonica]|uniref:Uncharacterized protein n=1 Tax=Eumeta variegata TaxID=151549 RepID=A0A4C1TQT7_EUMVA|nr:hypothetical protein EVAR_9930_1 [Eumeta japonica]
MLQYYKGERKPKRLTSTNETSQLKRWHEMSREAEYNHRSSKGKAEINTTRILRQGARYRLSDNSVDQSETH